MTSYKKTINWVLGILLAFIFLSILFSFKSRDRVYAVEVRMRFGNSTGTTRIIVKASNSFDAKNKAQRLARYEITTSVKSCKEIDNGSR